MKKLLLPVALAAGLATGCVTHGDVGVGYSYGYAAPAPDMYVMNNGVYVVAYADYPTFYADNYYWMYNNGLWYRSSYYGGGWVVSYDVPYYVRSIDRPYAYTRFTPGRGWTRAPSPAYRGGVRDHRTYNPGYTRTAPTVRDHRSGPTYSPPATSSPPVRDHRRAPSAAPTYSPPPARDHRSSPPPARHDVPRHGPTSHPPARDHRRR